MPDPDYQLLERLNQRVKLAAAGGSSDGGGMLEHRVASLETEMREVKGILARIEKRLDAIEAKLERFDERMRKIEIEVAELKGRISQLPTTWAMVTFGVSMTVALGGFFVAVLRFGMPQ